MNENTYQRNLLVESRKSLIEANQEIEILNSNF